ncbi:nicotinate-nucleotide adenylyltransferase [Ferruginivarius sediminum]|uniref:Probable nicotinate-nucleotide adenylyltransferase n=2 Tax=Ferruginivarius sediminum TaxID=2661937 RepID=A0A369T9E9_9PROT|nr:nicotinate-nucleotide adenylyltransferase [Ferruginivarius sediminum]RDD61114.1 nicotinate-nucleotide adenylyltransferase [Ferruginivarius sediminum]
MALGGFLPPPRYRVGLLGGSFNPAHGGHRFVSLQARRRLALDEVWWLVSPQNPLKPTRGMATLADRLASAREVISGHPGLRATTVEAALGTRYTADTLHALRFRFAKVRFVWLMGADNLWQIDHWDRWTEIFHTVPVAVFDRPSYSLSVTVSKAAQRFRRARVPERGAPELAELTAPAWTFVHQPHDPRSATAIRATQGKDVRTR